MLQKQDLSQSQGMENLWKDFFLPKNDPTGVTVMSTGIERLLGACKDDNHCASGPVPTKKKDIQSNEHGSSTLL